MYALRRMAVRSLHFQPTRQLSTLRPGFVLPVVPTTQLLLCRSLHHSRRWQAAEQEGEESVNVERNAEEQSTATSEIADAARETTQEVADAVKSAASSVARAAQFPANASSSDDTTKTLFVGNLFFEVTAPQLEAEFSKFGDVVHSRLITDRATGASKGFAHIVFQTREQAERAMEALDQTVFQGRRMGVRFHVPRERRTMDNQSGERPYRGAARVSPPSKTLYMGNLSFQMSDRDLNDLFQDIRNVLDVRVAIDRRSGQPRGFAHAEFVDIASAEVAKQSLQGRMVFGRELRVDFSSDSPTPRGPRAD